MIHIQMRFNDMNCPLLINLVNKWNVNWFDICGTSGDLGNEYKYVVNYILTVHGGGLVFPWKVAKKKTKAINNR